MKIAHFSLWGPRRSGLYEYTADQVRCERRTGLDSLFLCCEQENPDPKRFTDDDITAVDWEKAKDADVWVMHRSIPVKMSGDIRKHGNIAILHGTAEYMIMLEQFGKERKFDMHLNMLARFDKSVAVNASDYYIMKNLYDKGNNVIYIQDAIDLQKFNGSGFAWPYRYRPAIISTANIRFNKVPISILWAMPEIVKRLPKARLNLFGIRLADINMWKDLILKSKGLDILCENIHGQFTELRPFLAGGDIGVNSNMNGITSRDTLEQMAYGMPIISYRGEYTKYHAIVMDPVSIAKTIERCWHDMEKDPEGMRQKIRAYAEKNFCMDKAVQKFIKLYEEVIEINAKRKR